MLMSQPFQISSWTLTPSARKPTLNILIAANTSSSMRRLMASSGGWCSLITNAYPRSQRSSLAGIPLMYGRKARSWLLKGSSSITSPNTAMKGRTMFDLTLQQINTLGAMLFLIILALAIFDSVTRYKINIPIQTIICIVSAASTLILWEFFK